MIFSLLTLIKFALLILLGKRVIILLKSFKKQCSKKAYNIFLDCVIPLTVLFLPLLILTTITLFDTWFTYLTILLIAHIFIIMPFMHYWSILRKWDDKTDLNFYESWYHPRLYKHLNMALLYPLLWGLFFSLSRFFRLGQTYHIWSFIKNVSPDFIVIIFILPYFFLWLFIGLYYLSYMRKYFWDQLTCLLYSIHIYLLQYDVYFKFMKNLYKVVFFCNRTLTLIIKNKKNISWWQKLLDYLYYHPKWLTYVVLCSIFIESCFTKQIYYGIYTLFFYPILYGIFSCFFAYLNTDFVYDCCLSDYCSQRDNFKTPRYPFNFWNYFKDAEYYFGHEYEFTPQQVKNIEKEMNKRTSQWLLRKKVSYDIHQDYLNLRILRNNKANFCLRLAANYLQSNRVRWVHTERILNTVPKFHSCTSLFTKSLFDRIVLLNNNWGNLNHIQAAQAKTKQLITETSATIYKPFKQTFTYRKKDFIGIQEENIPSNFSPLIQKGVIVEPYDDTKNEHKPVHLPQTNPDIVYIFKNGSFIDKRTHAFDQKTNNPGLGNNKLLSEITPERYKSTIDRYQKFLSLNMSLTEEIQEVLQQLKTTINDFTEHQIIWAKNLHLFPDNHIPPLKLPQNFSYTQFTPEALIKIKQAEVRMKHISDYLYVKKIPQVNHGTFPKEALDLFDDSYIQKILSETTFDIPEC